MPQAGVALARFPERLGPHGSRFVTEVRETEVHMLEVAGDDAARQAQSPPREQAVHLVDGELKTERFHLLPVNVTCAISKSASDHDFTSGRARSANGRALERGE